MRPVPLLSRLSFLSPTDPRMIGLGVALILTFLATGIHRVPALMWLSPPMLAVVGGMVLRALWPRPDVLMSGAALVVKMPLRVGVALLGVRISFADMAAIGWRGCSVAILTVAATITFTLWLGARLRVPSGLARLIAAGSSICGASAVAATASTTRAADQDATYAIALVTVFGTISMLTFPLVGGLGLFDTTGYGVWAGSAIHEVAQAVAAAFQGGDDAGRIGTAVKLVRVSLIVPATMAFAVMASREQCQDGQGKTAPLPFFVIAFVVLVCLNSLGVVPAEIGAIAGEASAFLLTLALAGMGLSVSISRVAAVGVKPLILAASSWIFVSGFSWTLVYVLMER